MASASISTEASKQVARPGFGLHDAKASAALGRDHQNAELFHLPIANRRDGADHVRFGGKPGFAAIGDQADTEWAVFPHAGGGHIEVALLEYFQGQDPTGKNTVSSGKMGMFRVFTVAPVGERTKSNQPITRPSAASACAES
jgi:hypothetical protein